MSAYQPERRYVKIAYYLGVAIAIVSVALFALPGQQSWRAKGPANTGHQDLSCDSCHKAAAGTIRQQIQANVKYWLGVAERPGDLGYKAVDNAACLVCHERPNDRHPVFRFFEPRFAEARDAIAPQHCTSCHLEHQAKRVTLQDATFCVTCHQDTTLKNDPISVPHEQLISEQRWDSCMGCHDFHGNHVMETAIEIDQLIAPQAITEYFDGGRSPYSDTLHYPTKSKETED